MKQIEITNVYPIVQKIANCDLPYQLAWELVELLDEMKPIYEFQREKRKELVQKYKPEFLKESNEFKFSTESDAQEFVEKQKELDAIESELKTEKIRIPQDFIENLMIKPNELLILRSSGLIEFYKPQVIELNLDENKEEESK